MIDTGDRVSQRRSWGVTLLLGAALGVPLSLTAGAAMAEEAPLELADQVTDTVGALEGQETEVEAAVQQLRDDTGLQLFVVYVDDFDRADGASWSDETYNLNGFGGNDVLLSVAIDQRAYGVSSDSSVSAAELNAVANDYIEPALGQDDWAGATLGAVEGLTEHFPDGINTSNNSGNDGTTWQPTDTGSSGSGGFGSFPWFFAVPVVAVVGSKVVSALGNKSARGSRERAGELPMEGSATAQVPTQDLQRQAAEALVGLDNALRSAEEELTFAEAQFGQQRTQEFKTVLTQAKASSQEAFKIRQQLDDSDREDEAVASL